MSRMKVNLAGVELKNPVMTASGTFGSGAEYSEFVDLNKLGAVVTKGVANVPWPGNPTPRVTETASGMLNAIRIRESMYSVREIFRSLRNMTQRSLSMSAENPRRITVRLWNALEMSLWTCWRSMFPVRMSRKAGLPLARIRKLLKTLRKKLRNMQNSR